MDVVYILDRLDLENVRREERLSWFQDRDHPTAEGHIVWGKLIGEDLRRLTEEAPARR